MSKRGEVKLLQESGYSVKVPIDFLGLPEFLKQENIYIEENQDSDVSRGRQKLRFSEVFLNEKRVAKAILIILLKYKEIKTLPEKEKKG